MPHPSETDHQTPACPTLRATERPRVSPHGRQDQGACAEQPGGRGTQKVPRAPLEGKSRVRRGTRRGGPGPRACGPGRRGHGEQEPRVASRAARTQSQGALLRAGGRGPSEPLGAAGTRAAGQRGPRCRLRPLRWPVPSSLRLAQAALGAGTTNREGARGPGAEDRDAGAGAAGARGARTAGGTRVAHEIVGGTHVAHVSISVGGTRVAHVSAAWAGWRGATGTGRAAPRRRRCGTRPAPTNCRRNESASQKAWPLAWLFAWSSGAGGPCKPAQSLFCGASNRSTWNHSLKAFYT